MDPVGNLYYLKHDIEIDLIEIWEDLHACRPSRCDKLQWQLIPCLKYDK